MTIFETSYEVCNPVGGIHTVVSTKVPTMLKTYKNVYCIGPLYDYSLSYFSENKLLLKTWRAQMFSKGIKVLVGHWNIPGKPTTILVDYSHLWNEKNNIYGHFYEKFGVQSHMAIADYDDCALFGYAAGQVIESLFNFLRTKDASETEYVAQFHEWQTGFGLLYLKDKCRPVRTVFTTHATGIGRSIAFNGKPLYDYFDGYHGDQMAVELGFVSKHSIEKTAAHKADCFTTVSDGMARECRQLLEKKVDVVTPNGFNDSIVPVGEVYDNKRIEARKKLLSYAQSQGVKVQGDETLVCISGRAEWKNKGIDVFCDAIKQADNLLGTKQKRVIAFALVPYLYKDNIYYGNSAILFVPYFLDGHDPVFKTTYYDLLIGMDLTVFPSYYEPWGYTPLESIAFHIPTITTTLSGFGQWCKKEGITTLPKGVAVVPRGDSDYEAVVSKIASLITNFTTSTVASRKTMAKNAMALALKADWKNFFAYYQQAYMIALKH